VNRDSERCLNRCAPHPTFSLVKPRHPPPPPLPFIAQNRNTAAKPIPAENLRKQGPAAKTAATRQFSLACLPCSGCGIDLKKGEQQLRQAL
jgi:hypothetical protein